jgi:hypothetical protein
MTDIGPADNGQDSAALDEPVEDDVNGVVRMRMDEVVIDDRP